jgi:Flp pilus assembly protein protease CpaA
MWSDPSFLGIGLLSPILILAGLQDWRKGEVSNWISIPLFFLGGLAAILRIFFVAGPVLNVMMLWTMAAVTVAAVKGWMGGADWKVLIGLLGLFPVSGFAALIAAGLWGGMAMMITRDRHVRFPAVTAFTFAACLTGFWKLSIIIFD